MSSAANSAGNSRWQVAGRIAILGCSLVLALGVYFGLMGGWMQVFAGWTARSKGIVLNLMGFGASVDGTILRTSDFAANIVTECTAVGPLIVFLGAIVAYPATLRAKTIGAILGIVVLMGVNLGRIVSLFWIGTSYPPVPGSGPPASMADCHHRPGHRPVVVLGREVCSCSDCLGC